MKYKYLHPYTILIILKKFLAILALPIITQIVWNILKEYDIVEKNPIYFNVFIIVFILTCILMKYLSVLIKVQDNKIRFKRGIFKRKVLLVSFKSFKLIKIDYNIVSQSLGAYGIKFLKSAIYNPFEKGIYINKKIKNSLITGKTKDGKLETIKSNSLLWSAILSLFLLSPMKILFVSVPFIKKANKILSSTMKYKLHQTLDVRPYFIRMGVSPLLSSIMFVSIIIVGISAFNNLFNFGNFKLKGNNYIFYTESGLFCRHKCIIEKNEINAISVKYSLFMKIFKIASIYYHIKISKRLKNDNLLLLGSKYKNCLSFISELGYKINIKYKINKLSQSIKGFIFFPISLIILNLLLMIIVKNKNNSKVMITIFELFLLYNIWYLIVKIFCYKNTSICVLDNESMIIKGYRGMTLIEAYVKTSSVKSIVIKQNIFQRYSKLCTVYFYTSPNKEDIFFVKNMKYSDMQEILNLINMSL